MGNSYDGGMELVMSGDYSGFEKEQLLKFDSKSEFEVFFGKINRTRKPGIPIPDIDFEKKSVLVRLKGTSTNNISDITLGMSSNETLLFNKVKTNSRNETTAVLTPFFIYTIPKTTRSLKIQ
ncbi:hypothetical protein [Maribacter sp. 4G9]|uniref:hypothetical protein n=1 Tax=Maribacter sp. 4G9 TaxID=1889777 RepID=UPI000F5133CC|nr:hypothetical protein [Maribacter sp. 4G9]